MTFSWPWALLTALLIPLIFAIRWWARRRRRRAAVRVTSIALVRSALPGRTRWTRKIPAALFVAGLALLAVGAARPQASVPVPQTSATILLALDISGSMCSTDVDPNRLTAARTAAAEFIESQRGGPRIGLVTFAGTAGLAVPPTDDTDSLIEALENLTTYRGTAIGQAMLTSIDAIAEVDPAVAPTGADPGDGGEGYVGAAIVVLTDGANTQGVDPETAAREAALRRIRVFTIGFGTTTPSPMVCDSRQFDGGSGGWGGGFGGRGGFDRGRNYRFIDEPSLKGIARTTGGSYHRAENADQLTTALNSLPGSFTVIRQQVDTAAAFAAGGAVLIAGALSLSLWWNRPRPAAR
ncbi:VWA domain-containing protein [Nonomuraea gerenzanensis]|uniref:von Willebrand factor, type A n=1 Tax=Nonomuraea gerenzanensis TaxID=93944 RepID=A0A1M4EQS8_9ACTN|nr:VWA domain-containing protein [Nonomuraea gerenzanensis]UBU12622.1 VWA domain-containing protein [Nonomuraea gerenzanensis]SBP01178.1 von Willebrand factor, type A [Nonomuraea gerenzanensis]